MEQLLWWITLILNGMALLWWAVTLYLSPPVNRMMNSLDPDAFVAFVLVFLYLLLNTYFTVRGRPKEKIGWHNK